MWRLSILFILRTTAGLHLNNLGFLDAGASSLFATMMAKFVTYDCGKTLPDVLYLRTSFFFLFFFQLTLRLLDSWYVKHFHVRNYCLFAGEGNVYNSIIIIKKKLAGTQYRSQVQFIAVLVNNWETQFPLQVKLYFRLLLGLGDTFSFVYLP